MHTLLKQIEDGPGGLAGFAQRRAANEVVTPKKVDRRPNAAKKRTAGALDDAEAVGPAARQGAAGGGAAAAAATDAAGGRGRTAAAAIAAGGSGSKRTATAPGAASGSGGAAQPPQQQPKRPATAFNVYKKEMFKQPTYKQMGSKKAMPLINSAWHKVSEAERQRYKEMAMSAM